VLHSTLILVKDTIVRHNYLETNPLKRQTRPRDKRTNGLGNLTSSEAFLEEKFLSESRPSIFSIWNTELLLARKNIIGKRVSILRKTLALSTQEVSTRKKQYRFSKIKTERNFLNYFE